MVPNPAKMEHDYKYHVGGTKRCQFCDGTFITKKYLLKHIKLQHKEARKRSQLTKSIIDKNNVKCPICPYEASDLKYLCKHMVNQHENERFYCYLCEESFTKVVKSKHEKIIICPPTKTIHVCKKTPKNVCII